jgi:hypothetical protein
VRRHNLALILAVTAALGGCVSTPRYGDFLDEKAPTGVRQSLVADTVKELLALYPPASTRFDVGQPAADPYGVSLVEALRSSGYGVQEQAASTGAGKPPEASAGPGLGLRYVVDAPAKTGLYRVTVIVGQNALSRAYVAQGGGVVAAGAWVRKE